MPVKTYHDKTALVTGASSGIGEALAHALAARGSHLVLVARRRDRLEALATILTARHNVRVSVIVADLADPSAPARIFDEVRARGLAVDVLVNNAGFGRWAEFAATEPAVLAGIIDVNVRALVSLTRLFLPALLAKGEGGVINVGSTGAFQPVPHLAVYAASKAFVLSFSEALWAEVAPRGVAVLALNPGRTTTEFEIDAGTSTENLRADTAERVAEEGLDALLRGKPYHVVGADNWIGAQLARFLPRRTVAVLTRRLIAKRYPEAAYLRPVD